MSGIYLFLSEAKKMKTIFTCSELNDEFVSLQDAKNAWLNAGSPKDGFNSVWVAEHIIDSTNYAEMINTVTIG
jgi:hypothetical protein